MRLAVYLGDSAAWIEAAAARGVKVIALPRPDLVRRFRASSAVYAWSLFDEPDHNDLPARFLHRLYSALKRADGRHPIAVTFTSDSLGCRISPGYWSSFDLLMYDEYPFYATPGLSETLPQVEEHYRSCVRFARRHHKLGPILVLQGFGDAPDGPSALWRWPNAAEQRILATSAARIGASGVLWWADYRANALTLHTVDALIARESVLLAKRHRFRKTT
jgi:hypothetical protein